DPVGGLETFGNNPVAARSIRELDLTDLRDTVRANDENVVSTLQLLHCALRNQNRVLSRRDRESHATELAGTKHTARAWEGCLQRQRPCLATHASANDSDAAFLWVHGSVGEDQFESSVLLCFRAPFRGGGSCESEVLGFRDREVEPDRVE